MSKDIYTKIIGRLSKGCMGLRYDYFSQGKVDGDAMKKDFAILGDFKDKEGKPWSGGICFGLSVIYLAGCTPKGRSTWPSSAALMAEFDKAVSGAGDSGGMLTAIAQAYVRQKQASVMARAKMQNPEVLACGGCGRQYALGTNISECMRCGSRRLENKRLREEDLKSLAKLHHLTPDQERAKPYEKAHAVAQTAYLASLDRYRARDASGPELEGRSDKYKHAIRDQLMANFSLKPSPRHDGTGIRQNYKCFPLELAQKKDEFLDYEPHFEEAQVKALIDFCGEKNSFSLLSYEKVLVGGHQMAIWSDGSRTRFFDPNFGVISFSFQSGLRTFLSRYLPFLYCWKGVAEPGTGKRTRKSEAFMTQKSIGHTHWTWTSLDFDVYRYSM